MFWVWASQVAYNARFRQADWVQRLAVFSQLLIFCALAAYTASFDISNGIAQNNSNGQPVIFPMQEGFEQANVSAANLQSNRLALMNARGISLVMGVSRIPLILQYVVSKFLGVSYIFE